jgi:hypothetical protein
VNKLQWNVQEAHAEKIVIDEELEDERNVRLVWLELLAEDFPALKDV